MSEEMIQQNSTGTYNWKSGYGTATSNAFVLPQVQIVPTLDTSVEEILKDKSVLSRLIVAMAKVLSAEVEKSLIPHEEESGGSKEGKAKSYGRRIHRI